MNTDWLSICFEQINDIFNTKLFRSAVPLCWATMELFCFVLRAMSLLDEEQRKWNSMGVIPVIFLNVIEIHQLKKLFLKWKLIKECNNIDNFWPKSINITAHTDTSTHRTANHKWNSIISEIYEFWYTFSYALRVLSFSFHSIAYFTCRHQHHHHDQHLYFIIIMNGRERHIIIILECQ